MNAIKLATRKLFRKGEHTTTRIISLAIGLAFGIILLSEVFYYYSFDSFYPDSNRIYVVNESFKSDKNSDKLDTHPRVSGAIGPGMKAEVPGIEIATRINSIGTSVFYTEDNSSYKGKFVLADEYLFDVLYRPMVSGNAKEILQSPMTCMVSSEIALKMGGNVVGKIIEAKEYPGKKLTIGGVFESLPENTNFEFDIAISMVSTSSFTWDGTENWLGNDRYYTCVKLEKGISPESLAPAVRKMQEKNQNIEELELKNGVILKYSFESIQKMYVNNAGDMVLILSSIALIVLFVSIMNYMLLSVSTLVNRAKTSAIFKCYGAEKKDLQAMIFAESTLIFFISLVMAFVLILILKPLAEAQVGHSLTSTLNIQVVAPILFILSILMIIIGYFPGRLFAQIPVAAAFRSYHQKNTQWKKLLLAVQFTGAALILAVLVVVSMQYNQMKNANHGYDVNNVYYGSVSGMDPHKIQVVLNELQALPQVENAGLGFDVPINGASGNNVLSPDGEKDLFNVADFYYIDEDYLSILGIPIIAGEGFKEGQNSDLDVIISQKGASMLALNNGWKDGVVGKNISITEHNSNNSTSKISGVFPDFIIGSIDGQDTRPSVFFYWSKETFLKTFELHPSFPFQIFIKTHPINSTAAANSTSANTTATTKNISANSTHLMQKFTDIFNSAMLHNDAQINSLAVAQESKYQAQKGFRNAIYAGSAVILIISLMGLIGYLNDEIARNRKSLAIRKINGATTTDIVRIFVISIGKLAIPFVLVGLMGAWFLSSKWMQTFVIQIPLHWYIFALSGIFLLTLTATVAILNSLKAANQNPVESLRYE